MAGDGIQPGEVRATGEPEVTEADVYVEIIPVEEVTHGQYFHTRTRKPLNATLCGAADGPRAGWGQPVTCGDCQAVARAATRAKNPQED